MRAAAQYELYLPEARNISTVKNMIASMPLTCWIISRTRPMDNGSRTGREKSTLRDIGSTGAATIVPWASVPDRAGVFSVTYASIVATVGVAATGRATLFTSNFSHCTELSASRSRFLLRNQIGDSGKNKIEMLRKTANGKKMFFVFETKCVLIEKC